MEKRIETAWLLEFYGPLLTARQRELLELYCDEDLSLTEIAAQAGISARACTMPCIAPSGSWRIMRKASGCSGATAG